MIEVLDTLPEYAPMVLDERGMCQPDPNGLPVWSNPNPPPAIGDRVHVRVNGIGPATVNAYFVQEGFLGIVTTVDAWPKPFNRAAGEDRTCHAFGAEIR